MTVLMSLAQMKQEVRNNITTRAYNRGVVRVETYSDEAIVSILIFNDNGDLILDLATDTFNVDEKGLKDSMKRAKAVLKSLNLALEYKSTAISDKIEFVEMPD